jgi:hypothetical protein
MGDLPAFHTLGNLSRLSLPQTALFCSQKCPGDLILKAYDTAKQLREQGQATISGFQSPIEKDLLPILLRGKQPVVHCLARRLENMRIPVAYLKPLQEGRLLVMAPEGVARYPRLTEESAELRNRAMAELRARILVIHAHPGGMLERLCRGWLAEGKEVYALESPNNQGLFALGAGVWGGNCG